MNITYYLYKYLFFYRYLVDYSWELGQIIFIILWLIAIKKYKVSGQKTGLFGFVLFFIMMILSVFRMDNTAGLIGQYVFLLFVIAFIQEFYHFLKYENK